MRFLRWFCFFFFFVAVIEAAVILALSKSLDEIKISNELDQVRQQKHYEAYVEAFEKAALTVTKAMCPKECYSNEIETMLTTPEGHNK